MSESASNGSTNHTIVALPEAESSGPEAFRAAFDSSRAPAAAGCYIMRDAAERVVYVGKAKNLRSRIRAYLNETDSRYTVKFLMRRVAKIEFLVTTNEKEAVLLENSLIKQFKPRYNIQLKDDKTYVSLRLNVREDFPRITVVRRYKRDGARYFGPYSSAGAVRQTLSHLQKIFPLRTCSDAVMNNRVRPCIYYEMRQCVAPCVGLVSREAYREIVGQVCLALEGRNAEVEKRLTKQMEDHAEKLEFEEAALARDRLRALQNTLERQQAVNVAGGDDRDVFGVYTHGRFTEIQVLFYRGGKMLGGRSFSFKHKDMPIEEVFGSFFVQYYRSAPTIPGEAIIPVALEEADALSEILSEQRGANVTVHHPLRGGKRALVELANRNAKSSFEEKQLKEKANLDLARAVQESLYLPRPPARIECFDISSTQGDKAVGSMVVFENGVADKARYRHYAIRNVEGQDDFAMMREVLMRRYTRAVAENDLPDLTLIDGGKGQLGVATAVFQDLGIEDLPAVGIAKSRALEGDSRSPERFFIPGRMNPILLPQHSPVVRYLARIRDEAHRFANAYHRKKRSMAVKRSPLREIPGVGPVRARTLLNRLGSVAKIEAASVEEIAALPGFNRKLAETIKVHFGKSRAAPTPGD